MEQPPTNSKPIDEKIVSDSLRVIARFTHSARAELVFLNQDWHRMRTIFSWPEADPSTQETIHPLEPDMWMRSGWWIRQLRVKRFVCYPDLNLLPEEVAEDVTRLQSRDIRGVCLLAVYDGKRLAGILRLDNPPRDQVLHGLDIDLLQVASALILQVVTTSVDLNSLKRENARLSFGYWHDERTGLPNRMLFIERVKEAFENKGRLLAVLMVELDYFSLVEHRYGLEVSQRLFMMALERIQATLRASDYVSRMGNDRIGILLVDLFERSYGEAVANRILGIFKTPFQIAGKDIGLTVSIGAAFPDTDSTRPEVVTQEAEIALGQARRAGKERYLVFDGAMRVRLLDKLELENDLRAAISDNMLMLHYQPITSLENDHLIGFEALVRWKHPTRGMIWPIEFIRMAEETGLIVPLGEWVLREACRQMRVWHEIFPADPPLVISVNISPNQLHEGNFPDILEQVLKETGLAPSSLRLEITENVVLENNELIREALSRIHDLGVHLYIDDFGTGYSSLGYLDRLPADAIKIDRSFVNNLGRLKTSRGVIQAIIQLAHELNINVVAEGVETLEQHTELRNMHCEYMQGYYISQPLEKTAVERFIRGGYNPAVET